jgi:hypothetical protein
MTDRRIPERRSIDRCGFVDYLAWVRTGLAWFVCGGALSSRCVGRDPGREGQPDLLLHTQDLTHLSNPEGFDTLLSRHGTAVWLGPSPTSGNPKNSKP